MKVEVSKRTEKLKLQDVKYREMPDIVVKVHCKYRAELFFKISRKTKLSRLFNAWTERMDLNEKKGEAKTQPSAGSTTAGPQVNGTSASSTLSAGAMQFIFSHGGRTLEADQTPEEAGMEDGDEILAAEMLDLTEGPGTEDLVSTEMIIYSDEANVRTG
jgi:deferrochelatase/peroxidase EfeB